MLVQGEIHHQGFFLDLIILQGHHLLLMDILQGVRDLKLLLTWRRNYVRKRKQSAQDLMNRVMHSVMNGNNQDNKDLVITSKSIALVEILDGEIEPQVKILPLPIPRRRIVDHAHQEGPGLEGMGTQGVIGQGPVGARGLNVEGGAHLRRREDHDQKEERVSIDHPRIEGGGIPPLHHKNRNLKVMWKTGVNPDLPNQFKQRQRNLNR